MSEQMSEQEWLVRLQFLEEAQEYINTLESGLLGLGSQKLTQESIDRILRAAHSIKGGAALMGFDALSQVAHRLEDFFKVLQGGRYEAGTELERLFLGTVDQMRQMLHLCHQRATIGEDWLNGHTQPLLDQLFEHLGNPTAEDEQASLAADAGGDMSVMLFESEIGPCLDRLEGVLNDPDLPLLRQEFLIACPEMGSLGEMLELDPFVALCRHGLELCQTCAEAQLAEVCQIVLKSLRRSHGLVLVGQSQLLPSQVLLPKHFQLASDSPAVAAAQAPSQASATDGQTLEAEPGETADFVAGALSDLEAESPSLELACADLWDDTIAAQSDILSSEPAQEAQIDAQASVTADAEAIPQTLETLESSSRLVQADEPFGLSLADQDTSLDDAIHCGEAALAEADETADRQRPADCDGAVDSIMEQADVETFALDLAIELAEQQPNALHSEDSGAEDSGSEDSGSAGLSSEGLSSEGLSSDCVGSESRAPELTSPGSTDCVEPELISPDTSDGNDNADDVLSSETGTQGLTGDAADAIPAPTLPNDLNAFALDGLFEGMVAEDFLPMEDLSSSSEVIQDALPREADLGTDLGIAAPQDESDAIANLDDFADGALAALTDIDVSELSELDSEPLAPEASLPDALSQDLLDPELLSQLGDEMMEPVAALDSAIAPPASGLQSSEQPNPNAQDAPPETAAPAPAQDSSIRVSVRKIEQLGELLGELTTERNGLGLQISYLHSLFTLLNQRVKALDQANGVLRQSYDRGATQQRQSRTSPTTASEPLGQSPPGSPAASGFDLLEMDQYSELHLVAQEIIESVVQIQEVTSDIELALGETETVSRSLNRTAQQLQVGMNQMRMRPLSAVTDRFPRLLRELSMVHNKQVELRVIGGDTLIERSITEALQDPLMHLLRNCFDHGIEDPDTRLAQGKMPHGNIEISAGYRGNQVTITVQDDGAGINLNKIRSKVLTMGLSLEEIEASGEKELVNLIFEPGFSTADKVTDLSGRGVGMDVVRSNLQAIQGDITVETSPGRGSTFTLTVPLSLSVTRVLVVECQGMVLAFPANIVEEMLLLDQQKISVAAEQNLMEWQGYTVPLLNLEDWFHFVRPVIKAETESVPVIDQATALIVTHGQEPYAIECDRYWGEQEVTARKVEGNMGLPQGFSGCVVLGDGRIVPLVEMDKLMAWVLHDFQRHALIQKPLSLPNPTSDKRTILVIDDSINVRRFLSITLEKAGYHVQQAKDGQDAIEKLREGITVDVIMSDVEMPRLDGFGFLAQVKSIEHCEAIPVVMLTSRSGDKHRQLAMSLGAADYFSKPFKQNELLETLAVLA